MSNPWQFVDTEFGTGAYNMQYDVELVRHLQSGEGMQTVRVYRWKPWAISIGYNQDECLINAEKCAEHGIDIVRRPTGGRAILHAEELTYCVVMKAGQMGILDVYREISRALVAGLKLFGVDASLQRSQPDFPKYYKLPTSAPCFSSSSRYEIESKGRKLVGSAQRRYSGEEEFVLQHGSILTGQAHKRLAEFLSMENASGVADMQRDLDERTADLAGITGRDVPYDELANCIKRGFESAWGIEFMSRDWRCEESGAVYVESK